MAFAGGFLAIKLRLPPLVGYLLAGVAIGPFTPGFVGDQELASQLAEIGVILLMFGVGLHFSIKDLMAVRKIAIPGALGQIAVATVLGIGDRTPLGLVVRRRPRLRPRPLGRQHGGPAPRARGARRPGFRPRPHRRRLADRRGPGHGPGPGPAARAGRPPGRGQPRSRRPDRRRQPAGHPGPHPGQGCPVPGAGPRRRPPRHPLGPGAGRADRLARAVHLVGARDRARHRLRLGRAVRRLLRARRLLRRRGAERERLQPPGRRRFPAACRTRSPSCSSSRSACCSTRRSWSASHWRCSSSCSSCCSPSRPPRSRSCCCSAIRSPRRSRSRRASPRSASSRSSWPASASGWTCCRRRAWT